MKHPEMVNTRKIALLEKLGFDHKLAIEGGFDDEGFVLLGNFPDLGWVAPLDPALTKIKWPTPEARAEASEAMMGEYHETFGINS